MHENYHVYDDFTNNKSTNIGYIEYIIYILTKIDKIADNDEVTRKQLFYNDVIINDVIINDLENNNLKDNDISEVVRILKEKIEYDLKSKLNSEINLKNNIDKKIYKSTRKAARKIRLHIKKEQKTIERIKKDILLNDNYKNNQDVINNKTEIAKEIHEQLKNFISDDKTELSLFNKYKELLSIEKINSIISDIQNNKNESIQAKKIQEKNIKKYKNEEDKHILIKISEILHPYETLSTSTSTSDTTLNDLKYTCKSISI